MRILHVIPSYLPAARYGGPIFAVHSLCRALAARKHHVEVFTTNIDGNENSRVPIGKPVWLDGVQVTYFASPILRRVYWSPALRDGLYARIREFDLVHTHSVFLWPTWAAAKTARIERIPYIVSPRGMLVKHLIARRSRLAKSAWITFVERENIEGAAAVHVTSQNEATELRRFGWNLPPLRIIPNAVDEPSDVTGSAAPDLEEVLQRGPFVLYIGRLSWKKGLDRLIRSFKRTTGCSLVIAGTDDEGLASGLTRLAQTLGIADRVHIVPRTVAGADKEALFAAARVFVLASYNENFGNTVLEAMIRAVPVVVTRDVGAAEIVVAANGGFVVDGDEQSLARAIMQIVDDDVLATRMKREAQQYVAGRLSWFKVAGAIEHMYHNAKCNRS